MRGAAGVVVAVMPAAGLSPRVKPVATPVVGAAVVAVEAGARAEVVVAAPRGLSINARAPPADVAGAAAVVAAVAAAAVVVDAAGVGATPKVKPVPAAVAVAAGAAPGIAVVVEMGRAKRDAAPAGAACVNAGGAGVDEGLIPKANPPP